MKVRVMHLVAVIFVVMSVTDAVRGQPTLPITERFIERSFPVSEPIQPCTVPSAAAFVARAGGFPAGTESVPEPCDWGRDGGGVRREILNLERLTVREALDKLVAIDPRYRWAEMDGVIVLRPKNAWENREHFLHRTVSRFSFADQNIFGALDAVRAAVGQPTRASAADRPLPTTTEGNRTFSVNGGTISLIGALDAVVRAHGSMQWGITYCRPEARKEYALISLLTSDKNGAGPHPIYQIGPDGKRTNACDPGL